MNAVEEVKFALFMRGWNETGRSEGGYSNDPNDSGGETNWGITKKIARANGYTGEMKDLTRERARKIAKSQYWDLIRLDDVGSISDLVALEMFDTGFNCGQAEAVKYLQRALTLFNRRGKDYEDLNVDGLIGGFTLTALKAFIVKRGKDGETVLLRALNSQQGGHYLNLGEIREKDEDYMFGWFLNRVKI